MNALCAKRIQGGFSAIIRAMCIAEYALPQRVLDRIDTQAMRLPWADIEGRDRYSFATMWYLKEENVDDSVVQTLTLLSELAKATLHISKALKKIKGETIE